MVNIETVMRENNLQLVEGEFFRRKKNVFRVKDASGKRLILKIDGIDPFQVQLLEIAQQIEANLFF